LSRPGLQQHGLHVGIGGEIVAVEIRADRCAEQQVSPQPTGFLLYLSASNVSISPAFFWSLSRSWSAWRAFRIFSARSGRSAASIAPAQAQRIDVVVELDLLQRVHHAGQQVGWAGGAGQLVVDPVGKGIERPDCPNAWLRARTVRAQRRSRPRNSSGAVGRCFQAEQQIVAHRFAGRDRSPARYSPAARPADIREGAGNPGRRS